MFTISSSEFIKRHPAKAALLVADRDRGLTWKRIEKRYRLNDNNGMNAYRVYQWAVTQKTGAVRPKSKSTLVKLQDHLNLDLKDPKVAWARGWRVGLYAPGSECPYSDEEEALSVAWLDGHVAGKAAKHKLGELGNLGNRG